MVKVSEDECYEDVEIDFTFLNEGPEFGDLFTICGYINPNFPPKGKFNFSCLLEHKISQIDDYFGIPAATDAGDDVSVWLYPLIDYDVADHHPGPFNGLRLSYCVLRNPEERAQLYLNLAKAIEDNFQVTLSQSVDSAKQKIEAIISYWSGEGIEVGSSESLEVDF